jgi:glycosyltransferase involved in cell wall biosynthesis
MTALEQAPTEVHPALDVVIPVYNEERDLEPCVRRLRDHLDSDVPMRAVITIADNASTDRTWSIATRLAEQVPGVRAIHLEQKGRGRALRRAWSESEADIVAYTDVDLSTDLNALLPLVAPILSGHSDMAIGSRLARGARVRRGPKRELISRTYNLILRTALGNGFSDAQCGFKAMRRSHADVLLPAVQDNAWFFDTELLVLAERNGLRIHEVPVDWTDDPDSRVRIVRTALEDLRGVARLLAERASGRDRVRGLEARLVPAGAWRGREVAGALTLALCALAVAALSPLVGLPAAVVAVALAGVLRAALASARPVRPAERSGPERRPRRPRRPRPPRRPRGR